MLKTRPIKCLALGALLLALCTASTVSHGFSQKTIQNDMQSAAEPPDIEELFPRFTATASPSGHASAFSLEVLAPSESGELWLRWQNGRIAVSREALQTALPPQRDLREASDGEIEEAAAILFANAEGHFLLWTDLHRLTTYVLERTERELRLLRRLPCSAGDAEHPSPTGAFSVGVHRLSFGRQGRYSAAYALQISGNYLYHSVLLTPDGDGVLDGRLGERISHGCIRHSLADSRWLYETVPDGTAILIR